MDYIPTWFSSDNGAIKLIVESAIRTKIDNIIQEFGLIDLLTDFTLKELKEGNISLQDLYDSNRIWDRYKPMVVQLLLDKFDEPKC